MLQTLHEELEVSQPLSSSSIRNSSYIYNQMLKINGNKGIALSSIQLNQPQEPENAIIVERTFRSLTHDIDSKINQEFQPIRFIIQPHSPIESPTLGKQMCCICFGQMSTIVKIEQCQHLFCHRCVTLYLYNKIMSGQVSKITCPSCQQILSDQTIKQNISNDIYLKYQRYSFKQIRFLLIKQYEHVTNGKWCPRADCFNFVYQQGQSKTLECRCGQQFCFDCGNPIHPNRTCEESVDQAFADAIQNLKIQKCPNCKANIIKNGGCNHMYCTQCQYNFCWLCRCSFTSHHYDWMNPFSCPGEQYQDRDPYRFPKILICIRAIIKLMIYVLLSPVLAVASLGILVYGIGFLISRLVVRCGCLRDCLNDICC